MSVDYIPASESELNTWLNSFVTALSGVQIALGLTTPEVQALSTDVLAWSSALDGVTEAQGILDGLMQAKATARATVTDHVRAMVRQIQANPHVTDEQRARLGITIRDSTMTANIAAPASRPVAVVDTSERLRHTIDFRDAATPKSRAKPKGMKGCEIWVKIGTPPSDITGGGDPKDLTFLALDTATPYLAEYASAEAGKTAYYMLRWVSTRDEKGPWSETVEATIVG